MVGTCKNCKKPIKWVDGQKKFVHLSPTTCKKPEPQK